ncbi:unknown [Akkermansia sp. CAG:344]|nr:unknown [Akkermansia sp. CAG:344]
MLRQLRQARGHVAPQVFKPEAGTPVRARHQAAAHASGSQRAGAVPVRLPRNEHVFYGGAGQHGGQRETGGQLAGHVLEAVHRHVNAAFQEGGFQFLDEDSLVHDAGNAGHVRQRHVRAAVPGGMDDFPAHVQFRITEGEGGPDHVRLGQRQGAPAGADDKGVFTGHKARSPESIWRCCPG